MPGATPADAVREFIAPLQAALGCVARGKISHTRGGGQPKPGQQQQWSLNDGGGAPLRRRTGFPLPGQLELHASMYWRVIEDAREGYGPYRVTTTGYDYSLVIGDNVELWAMHWHAQGRSHEVKPHLHLGDKILADHAPVTSNSHLRTGRMTFETAIRWAIAWGADPLHEDWENRLVSPKPHTYCSAHGAPTRLSRGRGRPERPPALRQRLPGAAAHTVPPATAAEALKPGREGGPAVLYPNSPISCPSSSA